MKKWTIYLLLPILLFGVTLAACGSGDSDGNSPSGDSFDVSFLPLYYGFRRGITLWTVDKDTLANTKKLFRSLAAVLQEPRKRADHRI